MPSIPKLAHRPRRYLWHTVSSSVNFPPNYFEEFEAAHEMPRCIRMVLPVLFLSNQWSVTTSMEVHGTFTPAENWDQRMYTCFYSCLYSCVITAHLTGQDAHMNGNLALVVYKFCVCVSP